MTRLGRRGTLTSGVVRIATIAAVLAAGSGCSGSVAEESRAAAAVGSDVATTDPTASTQGAPGDGAGRPRLPLTILIQNDLPVPVQLSAFLQPDQGWAAMPATPADPPAGGISPVVLAPGDSTRREYAVIVRVGPNEIADVVDTQPYGFTLLAKDAKGGVMTSVPLSMVQPENRDLKFTKWIAGWGLPGTTSPDCSGTGPLQFRDASGPQSGTVVVSCRSTQINGKGKQTTETTIRLAPAAEPTSAAPASSAADVDPIPSGEDTPEASGSPVDRPWPPMDGVWRFCNSSETKSAFLTKTFVWQANMDAQWDTFTVGPLACVDTKGWMQWQPSDNDLDDSIVYTVDYGDGGTTSQLSLRGVAASGTVQEVLVSRGTLRVATGKADETCEYLPNGYPGRRTVLTPYATALRPLTWCNWAIAPDRSPVGWGHFVENHNHRLNDAFGKALIMLAPGR